MSVRNKSESSQALMQVLSLDVVLGSLSVGLFAVTLLNVDPNPWWWIVLAGSVWVVYTLDHLLDGLKTRQQGTIYRHRFHYTNRKTIIAAMTAVALPVIAVSLVFLDNKIIIGGIIISGVVSAYFAGSFFLRGKLWLLQKELFIAAAYISGILLAPLVWYGGFPGFQYEIVFLGIFRRLHAHRAKMPFR